MGKGEISQNINGNRREIFKSPDVHTANISIKLQQTKTATAFAVADIKKHLTLFILFHASSL
jgi:hypothetical protein